jgi:hypothetical protein
MKESFKKNFEYKEGVVFSLTPLRFGTNEVGQKFKYRYLNIFWHGFQVGKAKLVEESSEEIYVTDLKIRWYVRGRKLGSNLVEAINELLISTGKYGTLSNIIKGDKAGMYESHGWKRSGPGESSLVFNKK